MSDPTPEEIAALIARLRGLALMLLRSTDVSTIRKAAAALASLQLRAETLERERDEAIEWNAHWKAVYADHGKETLGGLMHRLHAAESRLAAQAKVIETISLSDEAQRAHWLRVAGTAVPALAWAAYKRRAPADPVTTALSALREKALHRYADSVTISYANSSGEDSFDPAILTALIDMVLAGREVVAGGYDRGGITLPKLAAAERRLAAVIKETGT